MGMSVAEPAGEEDLKGLETYVAYSVDSEAAVIPENIAVSGDMDDMTAVVLSGSAGRTASVVVGGDIDVSVTSDHRDQVGAVGVTVSATGAAAEARLNGQVKAVSAVTGNNADAGAIVIGTENHANAVVVVPAGDVITDAKCSDASGYTWAAGVSVYNSDSDVRTEIHGNVTANSDVYGVGLNLHSTAVEASATTVVVDGDLFGSSYGMLVEQTDAQKQMTVVVDGTVSGGDESILLSN